MIKEYAVTVVISNRGCTHGWTCIIK